nr:carboxypeptidase-like regulatory domain-containing protein [uncultured Mucilaginibacter sp.]
MKKKYLLILLLLFCAASAIAQKQVKGMVKDNKGKPVEFANVTLKDADGNIIKYTQTNKDGRYSLQINESTAGLNIEATCLSYNKAAISITDLSKDHDLVLTESEIMLQEVKIKYKPSINVNGDTLNYRTSDFAGNQDRSIGDVLRKMPGIDVADDGKISYNGRAISSLRIDGDNLLDDRYNIASRSIPHGAVDEVQVIQKDQPIKMLQKNNTSEDVALNLIIKDEAKLRVIGEASVGLGVPNRFTANSTAMLLNKKLKFINNITGNNIGIDPGIDLIAHNASLNATGSNFLSVGAAGISVLPQNRYLFNKAGLINLNDLVNINKNLQLKVNVSYLIDERHQQYKKTLETFLPGQTIKYTEEQDNYTNLQKTRTEFNLVHNSETGYFNDRLTLDLSPTKTTSSVVANGIDAKQMLDQKITSITNVLDYKLMLKSGRIVNLSSTVSNVSKPEMLTINPGPNEALFNNNQPYSGLNQYVKVPTWYTSNSAFINIIGDKLTQTYRSGLELQHQELNTELYRVQNDQTTELVSPAMINDLDWLKTKVYTSANYSYKNPWLTVVLDLPLSFNMVKYRDDAFALNNTVRNLFVDPSFRFTYARSAEHTIDLNYRFTNNLGTINDVYRGAIASNYRSLMANNSDVSLSRTHTASAVYTFTKAVKMLFANFTVNYSDAGLNNIASFILTNNIQQRVFVYMPNHNRNLTFEASGSKYVFALATTVNGGIGMRMGWSQQLQNGRFFTANSQTISYKAGVIGRLARFLNWEYKANYDVMRSKASLPDALVITNLRLTQRSTFSFTTVKNVYVNISGEHLFTRQRGRQDLNYIFADMNINFKLKKINTDIVLSGTNLTNIKTFDTFDISANSSTTASFLIPGRVIMLKGIFNF